MVSLIDLAPSTRTVPVGGRDLAVFGVSAQGIASLMAEFPELQGLFKGGALKFTASDILTHAPAAIASIIAAGCDMAGDPAAVKVAARLPVGDQLAVLSVVVELTMPQGFGPFMEALDAMMARLDFGSLGKAPDSKSASPSKS